MTDIRIFDTHTHAFPGAIAARAMQTLIEKADNLPHYHDGTFRGLLEYERNGGACGFLLLPIATKPTQARAANDWAAARMQNGVHAFGSVHPDQEDVEAELDHAVRLGLRGIKLHPEYQVFFADEARMVPIYRAIFDRGLILCLHAGVDLGFPPPLRGDAARIARVCDAFPDGKIIAAHMGGYMQLETVRECLAGRENLWLDTSFSAERMEDEAVRSLVRLHGSKRVMFATDAPWAEFGAARDAILRSGLEETEIADVLYGNAARLLGLDSESTFLPMDSEVQPV